MKLTFVESHGTTRVYCDVNNHIASFYDETSEEIFIEGCNKKGHKVWHMNKEKYLTGPMGKLDQ